MLGTTHPWVPARIVLSALACLSDACGILAPTDVPDCWPGMWDGMRMELTLVAEYSEDSPYPWIGGPRLDAPSCEGIDGLGIGSRVLELGPNQAIGYECRAYPIRSMEPSLVGVDLSSARASPTYLSAETFACGGAYTFHAFRVGYADDYAFGERAVEGMLPPLVVQRTISGDCDCFDEWVGEVRLLEEDAGP